MRKTGGLDKITGEKTFLSREEQKKKLKKKTSSRYL